MRLLTAPSDDQDLTDAFVSFQSLPQTPKTPKSCSSLGVNGSNGSNSSSLETVDDSGSESDNALVYQVIVMIPRRSTGTRS
jgi:hypothetical protein